MQNFTITDLSGVILLNGSAYETITFNKYDVGINEVLNFTSNLADDLNMKRDVIEKGEFTKVSFNIPDAKTSDINLLKKHSNVYFIDENENKYPCLMSIQTDLYQKTTTLDTMSVKIDLTTPENGIIHDHYFVPNAISLDSNFYLVDNDNNPIVI